VNRITVALLLGVAALATSACGSSSHITISTRQIPSPAWETAGGAIARVRSAEGFQLFPASPIRVRCVLPYVTSHIEASCQTRVDNTVRSGLTVTFTESWPAREFRTSGPPTGTLQHTWRYEIRPHGRVVLQREFGSFPPQGAK
jgi:hypothetical protein